MTDRPIIFSAPMVRALLEGRKTQTRRYAWIERKQGEWKGRDVVQAVPTTWRIVQPGDRLWVRESFAEAFLPRGAAYMADHSGDPRGLGWRPSIHMPRWASRLTLTVTEVRHQPLQEITEADAIAEGVDAISMADVPRQAAWNRKQDFARLWDKLHGAGAWDANPAAVALTFTVAQRNIDKNEEEAA